MSKEEIEVEKKNIPAACGFLPDRVPEVLGTIQGSAAKNINTVSKT